MQLKRSFAPVILGIVLSTVGLVGFFVLNSLCPSWDFNEFQKFDVGPYLVGKLFASVITILGFLALLTIFDQSIKLEINEQGIIDHRKKWPRLIPWESIRRIQAEIVNRGQWAHMYIFVVENGYAKERKVNIGGLTETPQKIVRLVNQHLIEYQEGLR